jgi:transcription antitermination factor NusG
MKLSKNKVWRAVYTKPRSEKRIAERLSKLGLEVFCPVQTTLRQWSDRKKKVSIPVFPSYVFLKISDLEIEKVLHDPGVLNFVYWLGKYAEISQEEIDLIMAYLSSNKENTVEVVQYEKEEAVQIMEGPFRGNRGSILETQRGKACVVISGLNMILKVKVSTGCLNSVS